MNTENLSKDAVEAINEEEACLSSVIDSLTSQLQHSSNKLQSESKKARELTSEIVAVKEEDKALLASDEAVAHALSHKKAADITTLEQQLDKPYFARFVLEEESSNGKVKQYEYKLGFSANPDARIIDWRKAPISKLYYDYKEGEEYCEEIQGQERQGTVKLRNSVDIEDRRLVKMSCRYGNFFKDQNDNWQGSGRPQPKASRRGTLPDVLSLITKDQFQTITEDAQTAILIQGIAGSGKTTVALHRLAWLLHEDNSDLKANRCIVVVLSKILKSYVENFLPSIGVPGVKVLTYHEWTNKTITTICPKSVDADGVIKRPKTPAPLSIQRALRSMALLTAIEEWEANRSNNALRDIAKNTDWTKIPTGMAKNFHVGQETHQHPSLIIQTLTTSAKRVLESFPATHPFYTTVSDLLNRIKTIQIPNFYATLLQVLSSPDLIIANDETRLLDQKTIAECRSYIEGLAQTDTLDYALDPIFIRIHRLRGGLLTLPDGTKGLLDHIVVDEAQDFSPMDLAIFIEGVKDRKQLTLVGDTSQNIYAGVDFPGWDKLMHHWQFRDSLSKYVTLTVSHRSTLQIMQLAEHVQGQKLVSRGRLGRTPIWFRCHSEEKGFYEVVEWLNKAVQRFPTALTAVITSTIQEARLTAGLLQPNFGQLVRLGDDNSFSFEEGIIVTDVLHAKGLEFTNVLLWNPTTSSYPNDQHGKNMLYTAMTRAEENLCIVTWGKPSQLLPPLNSKLVRGINVIEEKEEEEEPLPDYSKMDYDS